MVVTPRVSAIRILACASLALFACRARSGEDAGSIELSGDPDEEDCGFDVVNDSPPVGDACLDGQLVAGPESYGRAPGHLPTTEDLPFTVPADGTLCVTVRNGTGERRTRVTSASIELDGNELIGSASFNPGVEIIERASVQIAAGGHTLDTRVAGRPGTELTLLARFLEGDATPHNPVPGEAGILQLADLNATPDPFSPNSDGFKDTVSISARASFLAPLPGDASDENTFAIDFVVEIASAETCSPTININGSVPIEGPISSRLTVTWDGTDSLGALVPDGRYFYRIRAGLNRTGGGDTVALDSVTTQIQAVSLRGEGLAPFAFDTSPRPPLPVVSQEDAIAVVASLLSDPIRDVRVTPMPATGRVLVEAVSLSEDTATRTYVSVDETGAALDTTAAHQAETAALHADVGHVREDLFETAMLDPGPHTVTIFCAIPNGLPSDLDTTRGEEDAIAAFRAELGGAISAASEPLREWLLANGATDVVAYTQAPALSATLPSALLFSERLNASPDVVLIIPPDPRGAPALFGGHTAMGEPVSGGACGPASCEGFDFTYRVAIFDQPVSIFGSIEAELGQSPRIPATSDAIEMFPPATCTSRDDCGFPANLVDCVDGVCLNEHATLVASSIGTIGPFTVDTGGGPISVPFAGAPQHDLIMVNTASQLSCPDGFEFAALELALAGNHSVGAPSEQPNGCNSLWTDFLARFNFFFLTKAAGNNGPDGVIPNAAVDCANFNGLCVGSYDYGDPTTPVDDDWSSFSSARNKDDIERPHLVGPGEEIVASSYCASGTAGFFLSDVPCVVDIDPLTDPRPISGTSFAAPAVLGTALLAHEYAGFFSNLVRPVAKKAVLLASSAGDPAGDGAVSFGVGPGDQRDGAGVPNVQNMARIVDSGNVVFRRVRTLPGFGPGGIPEPSDFDASGEFDETFSVTVNPGEVLRVALAYESCPFLCDGGACQGVNALVTDLDLRVDRPGPPLVGNCKFEFEFLGIPITIIGGATWSLSLANEFEIIEDQCMVTADPSDGPQTFEIHVLLKPEARNTTCFAGRQPFALAWDVRPFQSDLILPLPRFPRSASELARVLGDGVVPEDVACIYAFKEATGDVTAIGEDCPALTAQGGPLQGQPCGGFAGAVPDESCAVFTSTVQSFEATDTTSFDVASGEQRTFLVVSRTDTGVPSGQVFGVMGKQSAPAPTGIGWGIRVTDARVASAFFGEAAAIPTTGVVVSTANEYDDAAQHVFALVVDREIGQTVQLITEQEATAFGDISSVGLADSGTPFRVGAFDGTALANGEVAYVAVFKRALDETHVQRFWASSQP